MAQQLSSEYSSELKAKIEEWLRWDKNEKTRTEIEDLIKSNSVKELENRLLERMSFGTAGLRARMGAGYSMMNDLTIIQTTQGFFAYLKTVFPNLEQTGIVVGFDGRYNSHRWAQIIATIFSQANVPVYLFRKITPTPFVPYTVVKLKCAAGVMVTASHNPKEDNGYKVYFDNGAQIIPPHDKGIAKNILHNLEPLQSSWNIDTIQGNPLVRDPWDQINESYFQTVGYTHHLGHLICCVLGWLCAYRERNSQTDLVFTYTAMHGVGYEYAVEVFKAFNHKPFVPVLEQVQPDPEFPTVKFPNPEEGKSALNLSIETANRNNSRVIIANDPDADRLAVAEKLPNSQWKIFTGNELGALFGWWLWFNYKQRRQDSASYHNVYMLYSTVSSNILKSIAQVEGFNCEDTLTGFKWMGNRAVELMKDNKQVLFAFEEAIGFMCSTNVLDKDGVSAAAIVAEMAVYLQETEKRTLNEQIDWLYQQYGYHVSNNSYYLCYEPAMVQKMFHRLRHFNDLNSEQYTYPPSCGPYKIRKIRDLTAEVLIDLNTGDKSKPTFPGSKSSEMITFYFENDCILTIRTSGTEPKIKWYSEIKENKSQNKTREEIKNELDDIVKHMVDEFYRPTEHNFKARST